MSRGLKLILLVIFIGIFLLGLVYILVDKGSEEYVHSDISKLPQTNVAVVLGTSSYLMNGGKNPYFEYRMDAAAELYHKGKVSYILASGDNRKKNYNEPVAMQVALLKRNVPADKIVLDYAGFRTFDSMVRAGKVFGQKKFIVVSQAFHNERAIYIARHKGMEAFGYNARDVEVPAGFNTQFREVFARGKMMLDLYILNTEPHFLGEKVKIEG